jgi:long-chain acyl-CoA synthetase
LNKLNFIEQSLVYGDGKPYLICLIVLSSQYQDISKEKIQEEIEKTNKNLSKIENIKKFIIVKDQFTIENGMMTPTMKLKRYKIIKNYQDDIEKLF